MKRYSIKIIFILFLGFICPGLASAEIDWQIEQTIKLDEKPVDMATSVKGTYLFALTDDGIVHAYDSDGNIKGEIYVGKHIDNIACGSKDNILFVRSKKNKEIQRIVFDFIEVINTEGAPFKGNPDAPIVISVFTDYQCPYCAKLPAVLDQVIENNKGLVKLVSLNFPLPMHGFAKDAAAAALTAYKMGKFWEYHEALYKNSRLLNNDKFLEIATDLGLDRVKFEQEMKSKEIRDKVSQEIREAQKVGATGTPTVFVNGRKLRNRSVEGFQEVIDTLLNKQK